MDFSTVSKFDLPDSSEDGTQTTAFNTSPGRTKQNRRSVRAASADTATIPEAILENWTRLRASGFSSKFYTRLLKLAGGRFGSDTTTLKPESLSHFLTFWEMIKSEALEPEISIGRDGLIFAEWYKSSSQRLDLKFSNGKIYFGLLDRGRILEGADTKELISIILKSHSAKPLRWPK